VAWQQRADVAAEVVNTYFTSLPKAGDLRWHLIQPFVNTRLKLDISEVWRRQATTG
jgi:hypothetical protein